MENRRTITAVESYNHGQKSWGTFAFMELFFQFIHKKTPPSPHKHTLDACIESFFPSFNIV